MGDPAYIALDEEGFVTLYWGNGSDVFKEVITRGPRPGDQREMVEIVEDMRAWAEAQGFEVIVPTVDLSGPDVALEPTEDDQQRYVPEDVDHLLDDLFEAGQIPDKDDY